jgi:hypothetical protein
MSTMDQRQICAIHEAGHVVMRRYHGLFTPCFVVWEDGTGVTAPDGRLALNFKVQLDVTLGGMVAEELYFGRARDPEACEIESVLADLVNGDIDFD